MRELIRKTDDGQYLVITSTSKVLIASPMEVPEQHYAEGDRLVNPPPAEKVSEEEPRTVTCRGETVPIKVVTVEDASGKVNVSLWRDASSTDARPGDNVTITDVVVNVYNNTTSLNTTTKSEVVPCEAPIENRLLQLFLLDGSSFKVPAELLQQSLSQDGESVDIEMATVKGPINLSVTTKGREDDCFAHTCTC